MRDAALPKTAGHVGQTQVAIAARHFDGLVGVGEGVIEEVDIRFCSHTLTDAYKVYRMIQIIIIFFISEGVPS